MSKKWIGIDIDSVLSDTFGVILSAIEDFFQIQITPEQFKTYGIRSQTCLSEEQTKRILWWFWDTGLLDVEPIPHASQALKSLSNDFKIMLMTARPQFTEEKTRQWLTKHGFVFDSLYFSSPEDKIGLKSNLEFIVEDRYETAEAFAEMGIRAFIIDYPYNRHGEHKLVSSHAGWVEILEQVRVLRLNQ